MSSSCQHTNPLQHEGTSQVGRFLAALDPANVELHGLDASDWLKFAYEYAELINFYPEESPDLPNGDWQDFFAAKDEITELLNRFDDGDVEPHLALFISFLKLLQFSQQSLNRLPKRHLDYYYQEVLKLKKKSFTPDRVHVLFELAKNAKQELIEEGTLLAAGKDSEGNLLSYKTETPLVVNPAKVTSLRSIFVDDAGVLRFAPMVNSADGEGADFEDDQSWPAFGELPELQALDTEDEKRWPEAELGFYISSPLLSLKEGLRTIDVQFTMQNYLTMSGIKDVQVFYTGEKEWLPVSNVQTDDEPPQYNFTLKITIEKDQEGIEGYSEETHAAGLNTIEPVLKIIFNQSADYSKLIQSKIEQARLKVVAEGIASLQLQNPLGNIDPSKPFMPFGSLPKVGSKLSISYPEMNHKPITEVKLHLQWLDAPTNFIDYYAKYLDEVDLPESSINAARDHFTFDINSSYFNQDDYKLFDNAPQVNNSFTSNPQRASNTNIEMILTQSFYHQFYQELYTNAVLNPITKSGDPETKEVDLPNEPYTPLLDTLTLDYTAIEEIAFVEDSDSELATCMYYRHPFGTARVTGTGNPIVPKYQYNDLYIGLENMEPGANISLLFQVAEGSENPLHSSFADDESPHWAALGSHGWIDLDAYVARNETNNFLRSGIVEVGLPKEAVTDHPQMSEGLHWLRIRLKKETDSVCKFMNVHAQASKAIFLNQENTTDHLDAGLSAETIAKLLHPRAKIKSISQPHASFGGESKESDDAFYRRLSERMRHKDRAVTIWDYEHLILQQFPSLYKVKCLNHSYWNISTNELDELSPGSVTLVLIPRLAENSEQRLTPRVSQDFIDSVDDFVGQYSSAHANVKAVNPVYEPVKFNFGIRFNEGLDGNFYKNKTAEDIKRLLAPWVFEAETSIRFGSSFNEYQIVNYLENLPYVDYITDFNMYHNKSLTKKTTVSPSNPLAILIPHANQENEISVIETSTCPV